MRLALKLFLAFMLGNIVLAGIYGYLAVRREERLFQETVRDEAETVGPAMESMLVEAWSSRGLQGVQKLVEKVATKQGQQFRVRWVWFDAQPGSPDRPWASPQRLTTVAIEQHFTFEEYEPDGTPALHTYWPVHLQGDRRGGLEFSHPLTELRRNENDMLRRVGLLMGGMVVLSGLLVAVLGVRYVGRPLRQLIEKVRRVAAGDLQGPIELHSHDELSELASSLNGMCAQLSESQGKIREETAGRIAAIEQLRHADRLKTVGRMASGIAHELGTPLNVVSGRADLIESGKLGPAEVAQSAAAIKAEATRMTKIIRQLLDFARANTAHKAAVDLRLIVSQTVDLLRAVAERKNVQVRFALGDEPAIAEVDAGQIQQVLTNLIVNAAQAMPEGGAVDIAVRCQATSPPESRDASQRKYYGIEIRDEGTGIPEENMPYLFEPFFTTKAVGDGTGLGLSIAYGIVQEHGGWIDVTSRPGAGSCFTVFLPEGSRS